MKKYLLCTSILLGYTNSTWITICEECLNKRTDGNRVNGYLRPNDPSCKCTYCGK